MSEKLYSRYLLNEHPITFHSTLAVAIGLNEAIILQKINLWLNCKPPNSDGRSWIYESYNSIQMQLPFLSESTIKRAVKHLLELGILIKEQKNKMAFDRTNWYSIDYDKIDFLCSRTLDSVKMNQSVRSN